MERQPAFSGDPGLSTYLRHVRQFPLLKPQEEFALARRWREANDAAAAHALVSSHLRLVVKIAASYRGYGLPLSELVSEGNVGLMQAVKRFDPEKGFRLATYAMWWIRATIHEHIIRSWSLVRMGTTARQKMLFFNLRKAKARALAFEEGDMHPEHVVTIARDLGVPEKDVIDMNRRLGRDASLNIAIGDDDGVGEWQDTLVDDSESQETAIAADDERDSRRKALSSALSLLDPRERRIFDRRRLAEPPDTLSDLGREFGISRERVRQIEVAAFKKVQEAVRAR